MTYRPVKSAVHEMDGVRMLAGRRALRSRALVGMVALCVTAGLALTACDDEAPKRPGGRPGGPSSQTTTLTFGIWGPPEEVRAYQEMVDEYNAGTEASDVEIESWPDSAAMMAEIGSGAPVPDLFLITRSGACRRPRGGAQHAVARAPRRARGRLRRRLLPRRHRGVLRRRRPAVHALRRLADGHLLQHPPHRLRPDACTRAARAGGAGGARRLDLRAVRAPPPSSPAGLAGTPAGCTSSPSLAGLSPFIYAGGGDVYNDDTEPTSLAFSEDDTRDALSESLELLRDPQVTLTDRQLAQRSALEWFKRGKLGMLPGFRELTPELRAVPNLDFDVMPMATLDTSATIGDFTGMCISSESSYVSQAADFMVYAIGEEALGPVVRGRLSRAPANLDVATSDAFLQPDKLPAHAGVFNASVSDMVLQPLIDDYPALERAVEGSLRQMFRAPVIDLDALTTQIDEDSRPVLDPDYEPETPDSDSPSDSPSE